MNSKYLFNKKQFSTVKRPIYNKVIGWPPLIICGPSGSGKVKIKINLSIKYRQL